MHLKMYGASARNDGFGTAGRQLMASMERVGIHLYDEAPIHFSFTQPHYFDYTGEFNIGYFPWESTLPLNYSWLKTMEQLDEVWVTSPYQQEVVRNWGFDSHVFEHGIDPIWQPIRRRRGSKLRFLFMGLEAYRKGGLEAIRAFNIAFRDVDDVELVLKTQMTNMQSPLPKIAVIDDDLSTADLVKLYHDCHVFVAPTYGEGFGIPARDAAATGMPVIATGGFLPYQNLLDQRLIIQSELIESPWEHTHPGKMFQPSLDDLVERYSEAYSNYTQLSVRAERLAPAIHREYNWDNLTQGAFERLALRIH